MRYDSAMNTPHVSDYESVLNRVREWPAADRFALVQEVLQTIAPVLTGSELDEDWWAPRADDDRQTAALKRLRGIATRPDRPAPTDDEIKRWREEWRVEKYG